MQINGSHETAPLVHFCARWPRGECRQVAALNIRHWLDEHGTPAEPVRRKALWVARMIEYGGPLEIGEREAMEARRWKLR